MVAFEKPSDITPEEYLERERQAETKSEYEDGEIVAMSGATKEHNRIAFDLGRSLGNQLEGQPCEPFGSDLRVRVSRRQYYYPDLTVVCGEPQFDEEDLDALINPTVVVEVLSETSARRDRVVKFDACRALPSLQAYILVEQDLPRIECFSRQPDRSWRYDAAVGLEATLPLPAIHCELRLSEVYARVLFPAPSKVEE